MSPAPPGDGVRYWLLTGDTPAGPFGLAEIHERLATGAVTWQTPACPVGGGVWLPLVQVPGVGPVQASPPPQAPAVPTQSAGPALPECTVRAGVAPAPGGSTELPGRSVASPNEAGEAARRRPDEGAGTDATADAKQEKTAPTAACPMCGLKYGWRDGRCAHCGHAARAGSSAEPPTAPLRWDCACGRQLEVSPGLAGQPVKCPFCGGVASVPVPTVPVAMAHSGPANADRDVADAVFKLVGGVAALLIAWIWLRDSHWGKFLAMGGLLGIGHAVKRLTSR